MVVFSYMLFPSGTKKTQELARLTTISYYRQAGAARPIYIDYPWQASYELTLFHEPMPVVYTDLVGFFEKDFTTFFLPRLMLQHVAEIYTDRFRDDPRFASLLFSHWKDHDVYELVKIIHDLNALDLSACSNDNLLSSWLRFNEVYRSFWQEAIFLDSFDVCGDELLHTELAAQKLSLSQEDLAIMTAPDSLSFLQKEERELGTMISDTILGTPCEDAMRRGESYEHIRSSFPDVATEIENHAKKYSWMNNDYATITSLTAEGVYEKICDHIQNSTVDALLSHEQTVAEDRTRKAECIQRNHLSPDIQHLFAFFVTLATFREHRKAYNQMASGVIRRFVVEVAKRTEIGTDLLERLFIAEIPMIFNLRKEDLHTLERRVEGMFLLSPDPVTRVPYYGEDGQELFNALQAGIHRNAELRGKPAYSGVVRGVVRLVLTQADFSKMQKGDILVAPNTRPEYVPIMKKAAAIITDEGGITSHAAIISRELKIPCIVGVQSATALLRDGDRVEVDAVAGVIRHL